MKKLSLCMIVKNEERFLSACLDSVKDVVDEIIIVDTGSTDNTIEIAKSYEANIYQYKWKNNFSMARNHSIAKATGDWILLLDADEQLESSDKIKLITLINSGDFDAYEFCIRNYKNTLEKNNYITHFAIRLIKNDKRFRFNGAIHEQLVPAKKNAELPNVDLCDITLHHYGYMDDVVAEKNKRSRNISLIQKQLKKSPDNPYYTFTLANEYMSQNDLSKAVELYIKSLRLSDKIYKFHPYAYHRIIMCSYYLKDYPYAIKVAEKALSLFPNCTDYEFCKGLIYSDWHKTALAVDSFKKCIDMGPGPSFFTFVNDCGTFKPLAHLGNIYYEMEDYQAALSYYINAVNKNPEYYMLLYPISHCYKELGYSEETISKNLKSFFTDFTNIRNVLLYVDVLLKEGLFIAASEGLSIAEQFKECKEDILFLSAKLSFYSKDYDAAYEKFNTIYKNKSAAALTELSVQDSLLYMYIIQLLQNSTSLSSLLKKIQLLPNTTFIEVCNDIYDIHLGNKELDNTYTSKAISQEAKSSIVMEFLDQLLKIEAFDLFEQCLPILNRIENQFVLLEVAKLLYKNGFKSMAAKFIIKSIKELDLYDSQSLQLLTNCYYISYPHEEI